MIITISGTLGSGEKSVAMILAKKLKMSHHSGGKFIRNIAERKDIPLEDFTKMAEKDTSIDVELDHKIAEDGITKDDLLIHNSKEINPGIHLMLANMQYPDYPVAFGIIRNIKAKTYDYDVNHQMEEIRAKSEIKCVDDLLNSGNTWEL